MKTGFKTKILVVEDNALTRKGLEYLFKREGLEVTVAGSVGEAEEVLAEGLFSLAVVDLGLPDGDGLELARGLKIPVLFLTARDDERSVISGLELGEDYMVKPFKNRELVARVRKILGRQGKNELLKVGELELNAENGAVYVLGNLVELTAVEFKLLKLLMENAGKIVPRERMLDEIWDLSGKVVNDNTLTVYVRRMRKKLGARAIKTVKNVGYIING